LKLKSIKLQNFRNYENLEFCSNDKGAIILGPNGSGKTNLLEAIAYSSLGKSFRYQSDGLLLRYGQKTFSITAEFEIVSGKCCIECIFSSGFKKITLNGIPVKQISKIYEYLKIVYCSPDDINLINGSPRKRRQYFDLANSQLNPSYIKLLRHYYHIVEQRNILLKDNLQKKQKKQWDELFIQAALPVIGSRLNYIGMLNTKINQLYSDRIDEIKNSQIIYTPTLNPVEEKAKKSYIDILKNIEGKEWQYQRTLIGPHLDDYLFLFRENMLRDIGSQGQKRSIALVSKIAHLELLKDSIGEYPVLLLDDIFAELDQEHIRQFLQVLKKHEQIFIATPNPIAVDYWNDLPVVKLANEQI